MQNLKSKIAAIVGEKNVKSGEDINEDYFHDEALTAEPRAPELLVLPGNTAEVSGLMRLASESGTPVTARGKGTGLCGSCCPGKGGILVSFERMNHIIEIDAANHVAVVEPGVTLAELEEAASEKGLSYAVLPGETSASIGGNVATNAGGMRAVKYGVTRHQVLGLEAVLASGEVIQTGGKFVKSSSGYDLTQIIIGSEGTLALATKIILKLETRLQYSATALVPFSSVDEVVAAVPKILGTGILPLMLEYIDMFTMAGIVQLEQIELGIPEEVQMSAAAYLLIVLEGRSAESVQGDMEELGAKLMEFGAKDVFVLTSGASRKLIEARDKSHTVAKRTGANDIVDVVVPRASIPDFIRKVKAIADQTGSVIPGCGHAGDGNIHLALFQSDPVEREKTLTEIFTAGLELGGAISAEHGIGTEKKPFLAKLENPVKLLLMKNIKKAFDPKGILNPGKIFD